MRSWRQEYRLRMVDTAPGTVRVTDGADGMNGSHHEAFADVLARSVAVLAETGIDFGVLGGVASAGYGRARWTKDIDVFCRLEDADGALDALAANGFEIERTNPSWICKAFRDGVQVDVIFRGKGGFYFDDRMAGRVQTVTLVGVELPAIAPEDLTSRPAVLGSVMLPTSSTCASGWKICSTRSRPGWPGEARPRPCRLRRRVASPF